MDRTKLRMGHCLGDEEGDVITKKERGRCSAVPRSGRHGSVTGDGCPCLPSVPLPPRGDGVSDFFSEAEQESRVVGCVVSIGKLSEVFGSEMRCEVG